MRDCDSANGTKYLVDSTCVSVKRLSYGMIAYLDLFCTEPLAVPALTSREIGGSDPGAEEA